MRGLFELLETLNPEQYSKIKEVVGEWFETPFLHYMALLHRVITGLTEEIDSMIKIVSEKTRVEGFHFAGRAITCTRKNCMTCLGKAKLHYPYLYKMKGGVEVEYIKKRDWRAFLSKYLLPTQVKYFLNAVDLRHLLIQLYHTQIMLFGKVGLVKVKPLYEKIK